MESQLVNFKQAVALKELGFPQDISQSTSYGEYDENGDFWGLDQYYGDISYAAPTLELVAKWLREEKQIYLHIRRLFATSIIKHKDCYCFYYSTKDYDETSYVSEFDSYEQALSAGIDKAIEILNLSSKFTH